MEENKTTQNEEIESSAKSTLNNIKDKVSELKDKATSDETKEKIKSAIDGVKDNLTKENLEKAANTVKENLTKENIENTVSNIKESLNEENREETINNIKTNSKFKKIITIVAIFLVVIFIFKGCGGGKPSDDVVIDCAKTLISKNLKAPSTAVYWDEQIVDKDKYGRYCVTFVCEASNSFGGRLQDYYVVVLQHVEPDGAFKYRTGSAYQTLSANYYSDSLLETLIENVKEANDWGIEPEENNSDE